MAHGLRKKRVVTGSTALFYYSWGSWAVPALLRHYYKCHITLYTCSIPKRSLHTNHVIFQKLNSLYSGGLAPKNVCVPYKSVSFSLKLFGSFSLMLNWLVLKINLGTTGDGLWHRLNVSTSFNTMMLVNLTNIGKINQARETISAGRSAICLWLSILKFHRELSWTTLH